MKEQYTAPEMEIIAFAAEDVIVTSISSNGTGGDFPNGENGDIHIG